jgi:hypothetical protein
MAGKKAVKDAGEELGLVVVDPADLLAKRVELRATGDRDIYLTPLTPSSSVWGHGRGFSEDIA